MSMRPAEGKAKCKKCNGRGEVVKKGVPAKCPACKGTGVAGYQTK